MAGIVDQTPNTAESADNLFSTFETPTPVVDYSSINGKVSYHVLIARFLNCTQPSLLNYLNFGTGQMKQPRSWF